MSSSFSKPQLIVPSPTPFWPCSSSSRSRKFRGTTETTFNAVYRCNTMQSVHRNKWNSRRYRLWDEISKRAWLTFLIAVIAFAGGDSHRTWDESRYCAERKTSMSNGRTRLFMMNTEIRNTCLVGCQFVFLETSSIM